MHAVLILIHLLIVLALIGLVLLQRSEGGGLGIGSSGGFLTTRGTSNVLSRSTAFLAVGFFVTSLVLSWLAGYERKPTSIVPATATQQQAPAAPGAPQQPLSQGGRGVLDTLRSGGAGSETPAAPSGPQVPSSQ